MYICESIGYMGSVALLLYKEFFMKDLSWSRVLMQFSYLQFCLGLLLLAASNIYFDKYGAGRSAQKRSAPFAAA